MPFDGSGSLTLAATIGFRLVVEWLVVNIAWLGNVCLGWDISFLPWLFLLLLALLLKDGKSDEALGIELCILVLAATLVGRGGAFDRCHAAGGCETTKAKI